MGLSQDWEYQRLTAGLKVAQEDLDQARINHYRSSDVLTAATNQKARWHTELDAYLTKLRKQV